MHLLENTHHNSGIDIAMSERNKFENAWVQLDAVDVFKQVKITILVQNNNILHHRNLTLTQSASSAELQFSDTKQSLRHWRSLKVLHRVISMSVSAYSQQPKRQGYSMVTFVGRDIKT